MSSEREAPKRAATAAKPKPSPAKRILSFVAEILLAVLVALVITALLRVFVFQVFRVPSGSMEQTLEQQDRIAAMRISEWQRGDIVVFEDAKGWVGKQPQSTNPVIRGLEELNLLPDSTQGYLVKRVIGMPGDRVACCDQEDRLTINGHPMIEDYLYRQADGSLVKASDSKFDVIVPAGHIFVMGDHRDRSGDSRLHMCKGNGGADGFVPVSSVVGPVKAVVLPFDRTQQLTTPDVYGAVPRADQAAPEQPVIGAGSCPG